MLSLQDALDLVNGSYDIPKHVTHNLKRWKDVYIGMSLHIAGAAPRYLSAGRWFEPPNYFGEEHQFRFENYLLNRHPYESEITRNWRYSQYKPLTKAPFQQCLQVVAGAIFQDSNYTIEVDNKEDNEYIWGNNFQGKNIAAFFAWSLQCIAEDPNGYFVTLPKEPSYRTTSTKIQPDIWFVKSRDVLFAPCKGHPETYDDFIFLQGGIKWHLNKVGIFRYVESYPGNDSWIFHPEDRINGGYFTHALGKLPIDIAGGIWNTMGYYDSWLCAALPIADEFIQPKSSSQLTDKEASHPFIQMANNDCPDCNHLGTIQSECSCNGDDGNCNKCGGQGFRLDRCNTCKGSGSVSINPGQIMFAPSDQMKDPLIRIENPDVAINKLHHENVEVIFKKLMEAVFLYRSDKAESGVSKAIDQETKYLFLCDLSKDLFYRIIANQVQNIISYRNVTTNDYGVTVPAIYDNTIIAPSQFQIKSSGELMLEYSDAYKANVPSYILSRIAVELSDKQFGGNAAMKRKAYLISQMDILSTKSEADKVIQKDNGAISLDEWRLNIHLPTILDTILREHGEEYFVKAPYETIKSEVDKLFKALPVPTMPATTTINENKTIV